MQPRRNPMIDVNKLEADIADVKGKINPVVQFAPVIERAPELTGEAIRIAHEQAATRVESAADALVEQLNECLTTARDTAKAIREFGEAQAKTIEQATGMVRDMARLFRESKSQLDAFKETAA